MAYDADAAASRVAIIEGPDAGLVVLRRWSSRDEYVWRSAAMRAHTSEVQALLEQVADGAIEDADCQRGFLSAWGGR